MSQYFGLDRAQPTLDFVDVDVTTDVPVFVDPRAIRLQETDWSKDCVALLQSFFAELLIAVGSDDPDRLNQLMWRLSEPNDTHLGFSTGRPNGRGLGGVGAARVAARLSRSSAAESRLLSDLEDAALLVDGIDKDIVSDMTTQIIRGALIGYTQSACKYYGIPMLSQHSGDIWSPDALDWREAWVELPRTDFNRLLLVPRSIVRASLLLDKGKYYRGFLAEHLENREIDAGSNLVTILKNGTPRVYRKDLAKKYPDTKPAIVEYTKDFPDALPRYKSSVSRQSAAPLTHEDLSELLSVPTPDYEVLLNGVLKCPRGNAAASQYHRAAEKLLTALFYPHLGNVRLEKEIHEGRKRIDIAYDNLSPYGTFFWLSANYRAAIVPVECKNYSRELENPELDQMSGRFADRRGWVGMIVCRELKHKDRFLARCCDTARDGRGYIIALDDSDLRELVQERRRVAGGNLRDKADFALVRARFDLLLS